MTVSTIRTRYDRKTGKEIGRFIVECRDASEDEYADAVIYALLGKSPEEAARYIRSELIAEQGHIPTTLTAF